MIKVKCNNTSCIYNESDIIRDKLFGLIISNNSYCTKNEIDIFNEECTSFEYPYSMPEHTHNVVEEFIIL